MSREITLERVEAAMQFLAESDIPFAEGKANVERMDILRKRIRQRVFLTEDGTIAERNAKADVYQDTVAADDNYIAAMRDFETMKAKRQRAELVIDIWRTLEASRRKAA